MSHSTHNPAGRASRRDFLQAGALGLLGALSAHAGDDKPDDVLAAVRKLPPSAPADGSDWLIESGKHPGGVFRGDDGREIVLANGLIRRAFRVAPNAGCVAFDNLMTGESLLRGVKPEARLRLDGVDCDVGGLSGQPNYAYLDAETEEKLTADPLAFRFVGYETGKTRERFAWKRKSYSPDLPWPPPGASLTLRFEPTPELSKRVQAMRNPKGPEDKEGDAADFLKGVEVAVHYEIYDDVPLLCKWLTVRNWRTRATCGWTPSPAKSWRSWRANRPSSRRSGGCCPTSTSNANTPSTA